jgi:hypothetical protein
MQTPLLLIYSADHPCQAPRTTVSIAFILRERSDQSWGDRRRELFATLMTAAVEMLADFQTSGGWVGWRS